MQAKSTNSGKSETVLQTRPCKSSVLFHIACEHEEEALMVAAVEAILPLLCLRRRVKSINLPLKFSVAQSGRASFTLTRA